MILSRSENGEFVTAPLDQPVQIQIGDEVIRDGNTITVLRNGTVVAVRTFGPASVAPVVAQQNELISSVLFFRSNPVSGQSVVLTGVTESQSGVVTFKFSNGSSREFTEGWSQVGSLLGAMDTDPTLAEDILMLKSFRNSPDGTNKLSMLDVNCAVNFDAGTPIALIEV